MRTILLVVVVLAAACGPAPAKDPLPFPAAAKGTAAPTPEKMGPYQVGVHTQTYEDTSRTGPDGGTRHIVTEIWYPAPQSVKGQTGVTYDISSVFTAEQRAGFDLNRIPLLQTPAVRDAPYSPAEATYPVIIFSHGHGGLRWQSTFFTVLLASHGYVVISPDHEGDTLDFAVRGSLQSTTTGIEQRPADILYLLNRLDRLKEDDFLYGHVDTSRIGMSGHSFGALTSLRVPAMDPKKRIKVIVPQAPTSTDIAWLGLSMPVNLGGIPVMIQAGKEDDTLEYATNAALAYDGVPKPKYLFNLIKGGHFTYSDLCAFDLGRLAMEANINVPGANIQKVLNDGCGATQVQASVAQPLINHFAVALFNSVLRGNEASAALLTQDAAEALGPGAVEFKVEK